MTSEVGNKLAVGSTPVDAQEKVRQNFDAANQSILQSPTEQKTFFAGTALTTTVELNSTEVQSQVQAQADLGKKNNFYLQGRVSPEIGFSSSQVDLRAKELMVGYSFSNINVSLGAATQQSDRYLSFPNEQDLKTVAVEAQRAGEHNAENIALKVGPRLQSMEAYSANHTGKLRYQLQGSAQNETYTYLTGTKSIFGGTSPQREVTLAKHDVDVQGTVSVPLYKFISIGGLAGLSHEKYQYENSSMGTDSVNYGGVLYIGDQKDDLRVRVEVEKTDGQFRRITKDKNGMKEVNVRDISSLRMAIGLTEKKGPLTFDFSAGWDTSLYGLGYSVTSPISGAPSLPSTFPVFSYLDVMYAKVRLNYDF